MFARLFAACVLALGLAATTARAADLSDAVIAHIAYTAGEIDIAAAKVALEKSKDTEVRAFAQNMVDDHTAVNQQAWRF